MYGIIKNKIKKVQEYNLYRYIYITNRVIFIAIKLMRNFFLKNKYLSIFMLLPLTILMLYYFLLVSPRYESTAILTLKQNDSSMVPDMSLGILGGMSQQSSTNDYLLINYILSTGMLKELNKQYNLKKIYQSNSIDFISRLSSSANQQDFLDYYQNMVSAEFNLEASMITLSAQAYTPSEAKKILTGIIANSQNAVDNISHTLAAQRMHFSKNQMDFARNKALKEQQNLLEFQNKYGIVDPESSILAVSEIINSLQLELAQTESELTALQAYLNDRAPEIKAAQQKIMALKKQIAKEKTSLLSVDDQSAKHTLNIDQELNQVTYKYSWLKLNAEFSLSEYTAAMQSYEVAKMDTLKQQSYLVTIVEPTLPDDPSYPKTWYNLLTLLIILLAIYGIGRMIITIILEHR